MDTIENTKNVDKEGKGADPNDSDENDLYSIHPIGNWFSNDDIESTFLSEERRRCFNRFLGAVAAFVVICLIYIPLEGQRYAKNAAIASCSVVVLAAVGTWLCHLLRVQGGTHRRIAVRLAAVTILSKLDKAHEIFTVVYAIATTALAILLYRVGQSNCFYIMHHHDGQDHHTDCPFHFFSYFDMILSVSSHVIGQPRFFLVVIYFALAAIVTPLAVSLHDVSSTSVGLIWVFHVVFIISMAMLKHNEERKQRERFVAQRKLECRHVEIVERTASLREFVLSITPPHLRSRLKNASQTISADRSENAVCLVMHNRNVVQFMQEVIPTEGAKRLALFRHLTERVVKCHSFHMVRSFGDAMYFVSNLFREDYATTEAAVAAGIRAATEIEVPSSWTNAAGDSHLQVCCGLAVGTLTGLPVGTTCIQYDVFGPVVSEAHSLAVSSTPGQVVHVSGRIQSMFGSRLRLLPRDNSTTTTVSDFNQISVNPSSPPSLPSAMACGVVGDPPVLDTGGSCDASNTVPQSTSPPNSSPSENPLSGESSSQQNISSSGSGFDVMDQIGHRSNGCGTNNSRIIRIDIAVSTRRNLQLEDETCCWVPQHFADRNTRAEAIAARLQRSSRPFCIANAMCSLLLMIVVLVACTDDAAGVGDLSEPRHVAGTVLTVSCSLALLALSVRVVFLSGVNAVEVWHQWCSVGLQLLSLMAIGLLRPTLASESGHALHFIFFIAVLSLGMGPRSMIASITAITIVQFAIELLIFPRVARSLFFSLILMLMFINSVTVSWAQSLQLYINTAAAEDALDELTMHEQIRNAILAAVIPPPLVARIHPSELQEASVNVWGVDQCVSVILDVANMMPSSIVNVVDAPVTSLQQAIDQRMNVIENAVKTTPNKQLTIAKVLGGSVLIAGPLQDPPAQEKGDIVSAACCDGVHILKTLLLSQKHNTNTDGSDDAAEESKRGQSYKLDVDTETKKKRIADHNPRRKDEEGDTLSFTAAVALEQGINVLTTSAFPQYELMGPVVTTARGLLAAAAPAEMVVCTERFTNMYTRECVVDEEVEMLTAQQWRLRDTGSIRVRCVKLK